MNDSFYILSFSAFSNLFRVEMMPQRYFLIFWIFFSIFLKFSLTRTVGTERNGMKIFIFSLSHHFPTYFRLKWNHNGIFYFFEFFYYFFGIFYYASCRNGTDRQFLFFILLGIFQPILAWNEAVMAFFKFLNFFWNFLFRVG